MHPCLPRFELQKYCEEKGILLTAYSPLGKCSVAHCFQAFQRTLSTFIGRTNPLFSTDPDFAKIVEDHKATPAQISVSWLVQRGIPPLPKSVNVERMKNNKTVCPATRIIASTPHLALIFCVARQIDLRGNGHYWKCSQETRHAQIALDVP